MPTVVLYCWCHSDSAWVLLYFTFRVCNFAKWEEIFWNNTEIFYGYVETNSLIFKFTRQLNLKFQKLKIFKKYCLLMGKFIMFIDGTLSKSQEWWNIHHFTFPRDKIEGLSRWGLHPNIGKVTTWNFTVFSLGYIDKKVELFTSPESKAQVSHCHSAPSVVSP